MLIVDIFGYVGLGLNLIAVMAPTRNKLLVIQIASSLFFSFHYLLLGAFSGALQIGVTIIRNTLFINSKKFKQQNILLIGVMAASVILAIIGWQGWVTLLIMCAVLLGTIGRWQNNLEVLLVFSFIATLFTLAFAIAVASVPAIISSMLQLVITGVAVARNEWKTHFLQERFQDWHLS